MKRTIRVILASAGAAAVVTGGALGVAYATTPAPAPAKTSPSPDVPSATQATLSPEAKESKTPEVSEPSTTVSAEAQESEEASKAPTTTKPSGTVKPHDESTTSVEADEQNNGDDKDSDHAEGDGDHRPIASPTASRTSIATATPDRTRTTRR